MTLPEILRDAILLLDSRNERERTEIAVVIARGAHEPLATRSQAFQIWLRRDDDDADTGLSEYRCEARSWLGEQWSLLRENRSWLGGAGFDLDDVLATDWRIVS